MISESALRLIVVFSVLVFLGFSAFAAPLKDFPQESFFRIEDGLNLSEIAEKLKQNGIIKSDFLFKVVAKTTGNESGIKSGDYWLEEPISLFKIFKRLIDADFGITPIKITVPEGAALKDIAEIFSSFENFDKTEFLNLTQNTASGTLEGYLFPDTYFFIPNADSEKIIKTMKENFNKKVIDANPEAIIMASLIEKEASNYEDRRVISGILWKRIEAEMPLQVDAVFPYIKGKNNGRVTFNDLKIDSSYNTYLNKGLPPTPICNPGLDAIDAALNPVESPYWFYLSDKNGITHFAKNFEEHKKNRAKYLK